MNGGGVADPITEGVAPAEGRADCSYCGARNLTVPAAMHFFVPTPAGEVRIALCPRHLAQMIEELSEAERQITGVKRPAAPKLAIVRR